MKHRPILLLVFLLAACSDLDDITGGSARAAAIDPAAITVSVAMSNLNSPRGMAWGPEGGLYVAESGTLASSGWCAQVMEGANVVTRCFSGTGSISRLWKGRQERVLSGLPSSFIVENGFAAGPQDISFQGRGNALVTLGCGCDPAVRSALGPDGPLLGTLIDFNPGGRWRVVADIAAFEGSHNPAGGPVDSNPYGLLAEGGVTWVADAGGNSLLRVSPTGTVATVATLPSVPVPPPFNQADAVPTRVRRGPDGALYLSTLTGVPFVDGAAGIYRIVPGQAPQLWLAGFKAITDFDFGPDGSVYVLQFASGPVFFGGPGLLIRVAADGSRQVMTSDLFHPTGVLAGPDGSVYVANRGTQAGAGEVLRLRW